MALQYLDQANIKDQTPIVRLDLNVPLKEGEIQDTSRADAALETINYLINQGAKKIILMSHLGRPKGEKNSKFSLEPVANYLAQALKQDVLLTDDSVGPGVKDIIKLSKEKVILLENLRFYKEETENEENFARELASLGTIYVNDAFGVSHRKHASVHQIVTHFKKKAFAGFLIKKEIEALNRIIEQPQKPFVAIVGGAKVSDKIKTIERLLTTADHLIIGGAMAYPFLKVKGFQVGKSLCSDEDVSLAKSILNSAGKDQIHLPLDHKVAKTFEGDDPQYTDGENIQDDFMGLDIGERTIRSFEKLILEAKTILWNGPMGLFENPNFAQGTVAVCRAIGNAQGYSVVGGGDSVAAIKQNNMEQHFSHISTGGGASLEYIEKGSLPGLNILKFGF